METLQYNRERKVMKMEQVLELGMVILLDAATFILLLNLLKNLNLEEHVCRLRLVSGTFAIGFALGVAAKFFDGGSCAAMILYALGFMLAYTAFVFTFPEKRKCHESR